MARYHRQVFSHRKQRKSVVENHTMLLSDGVATTLMSASAIYRGLCHSIDLRTKKFASTSTTTVQCLPVFIHRVCHLLKRPHCLQEVQAGGPLATSHKAFQWKRRTKALTKVTFSMAPWAGRVI